jgi:hypothetical protein
MMDDSMASVGEPGFFPKSTTKVLTREEGRGRESLILGPGSVVEVKLGRTDGLYQDGAFK